MANQNLRVNLDADPSGLERGFKSAAQSARVFERELKKVEDAQQRQGQLMATAGREMQAEFARRRAAQQREGVLVAQATREMEADFARRRQAVRDFSVDAGQAMLGFGAALTVGLGLAARAAMEWESAFAGVRKVVDGSPEEIADLEQQLRGLAKTLPVSATEIAHVAEAAGQLGVARQDIASFTQTAIALGVTTNLSAEDAATALARLGNIMGVTNAEVGRAGAALVALGNAGASTESDIIEMGLRIGAAGRQVGLTEAQVLGFANALSSVGIEAEAGGTAISRVMLDVQQAVTNGGDKLALFAKVSGVSAKEFAARFRTDAAGALTEFIGGLGRMSANGENTVATLGRLGLSEIRVRDTLLRSSGAADKLAASVKLGSDAWSEQTALLDEASKRYQTAESRIQIARNQINDAAIDIGAVVLPAFARLAEGAGGVAEFFAGLPGPIKQTASALGVAAAAVGLLGGAALIAVPKVAALLETLDSFGGRGAKAAGGLRKAIGGVTGVLAGPWGVALAVGATALGVWAAKQAEARARVRELADALDQQTGAVTTQARAMAYSRLEQEGIAEIAQRVGLNLAMVTDAALGNVDAQQAITDVLEAQRTAYLASDNVERGVIRERIAGIAKVRAFVAGQNGDLAEAQERVKRGAEAMGQAVGPANDYARAQKAAGEAAALSSEQVDGLVKSLRDLNQPTLDARDAARDYQAALDDARKSLKENGKSLDTTTEKGRANAEALDAVAAAAQKRASAILESTGSEEKFRNSLKKSQDQLTKVATKFFGSEEAARRYAESVIKIPDKASTTYATPGLPAATLAAKTLNNYLSQIDGRSVAAYVTLSMKVPAALNDYLSGRPPRRATGGEITGPGTATSDSIPALLSNGEHVLTASEVSAMGGQAAVYRFRSAVRSGRVQRFASGGAVGRDKEREKEERERLSRVRELLRELRVDIRRGNILDSVEGGLDGGYSVIDRLRDLSRNKDLSKGQRRSLARLATDAEPALRRLWREAERIDTALEKAKGRLEEMTQLRDQVASGLSGRFSFSDAVGRATTQYDRADGSIGTRVDVVKVRQAASAYASKLKTLAARLDKLRKLGMPTSLLQEIAGLEPDLGIATADAWIGLGKGEIRKAADAFGGIDKYANRAGKAVGDSLYKGGIDGARRLVAGLEDRQSDIEKAVERIGRRMQKALLKGLSGSSSLRSSSVVVGASAAAGGGTVINNVFPLDGAAVVSGAEGYATAVVKKQNRQLAVMTRRSA